MDIKIHSHSINDRKKKYLLSKTEKYIKLLGFSKLMRDRSLTIKVLKKGRLLKANEDDAVYYVNVVRRKDSPLESEHTIVINYKILNNRKTLLKSLLHELVHLKQYLTRKLIYVNSRNDRPLYAVWNKKRLGTVQSIPYWRQPWEMEARYYQDKYWKEKKL